MNNTDRKRLKRIYNCLTIPGCFAGPSMTQSMSIEGATGYAYDTSYALPKARELLSIIGLEEMYEGRFEEKMTALEAWHAKRVVEDWKHPGKVTKQTTEATHEKS